MSLNGNRLSIAGDGFFTSSNKENKTTLLRGYVEKNGNMYQFKFLINHFADMSDKNCQLIMSTDEGTFGISYDEDCFIGDNEDFETLRMSRITTVPEKFPKLVYAFMIGIMSL